MPSKEKAQKEKKLFDKTYPIFRALEKRGKEVPSKISTLLLTLLKKRLNSLLQVRKEAMKSL